MLRCAMTIWTLTALVLCSAVAKADCVVLFFQSAQCQPCKQMEPALHNLQGQGLDIRSVEAPEQLDLAKRYQIKNLPTLIVLRDGREVDRIVGVVGADVLASRLGRAASRGQSMVGEPSQAAPTGPVIRGQSPPTGFPLLASAGSVARTDSAWNEDPPAVVQPASYGKSESRQSQQPSPHASATDSPGDLEQAFSRAMAATVRIRVEESNTTAYGTGTIVAVHGQEALVLTCGHLFRDMLPGSKLTVELLAGTPRQSNVLAQLIDFKADKEDIALLTFQLPVTVQPVEVLPRDQRVQVGQQVFSIGCDHGANPTRRDTRITHVNRYLGPSNIEIAGAPAVGRSGGGLFDARGRLIGVCNAACNQDDEGIYASAEVIYQQLARVDQAHLFGSGSQVVQSNHQSNAQPVVEPPVSQPIKATQVATNRGQVQWPDERTDGPPPMASLSANRDSRSDGRATQPTPSTSAVAQLICVVRDGSGQDRVVTIDQPSAGLLQAIEQHGSGLK
ncbi:MAG: trypsin-like peptidase domain-containing protein [Pirellulaceae bacterium]|nr:trypsin-like peptidase domain-containing protein [Pirellulaceae bacterium]